METSCNGQTGFIFLLLTNPYSHSRYTFEVGPVFTLIELKLLSHILKLFGIPNGDGIFSPGGSISILYGLVAARYKKFPDIKAKGMRNLPEMVIFTSEDVSLCLVFGVFNNIVRILYAAPCEIY